MKISSLIIVSAMAAATTAESAHAEILTMTCEGYNVVFSPGSLTSHAPKKDRDYPITKVDVQNDRTIVSGITKYGKITAFFSNDGHSSIVWTNGKDVVLNQCAGEVAASPQPPVQEGRLEAIEAATRAEEAAKRAENAAPVVFDEDCRLHAGNRPIEGNPSVASARNRHQKLTVDADGFPIQDVETVCRRVNAPSAINNRVGPPSQAAMNVCIDFVQPYYNSQAMLERRVI